MAQTQTTTQVAAPATADPAPLGLMGFGVTTLVLSIGNSGLASSSVSAASALPLALAFGGFAQLLAGMWAFRAGNTFAATAFTAYGAFWLSFYVLATGALGFTAKPAQYDVATYLLGWAIFTLIMTFATFRLTATLASLFTLLTLTFAALSAGDFLGKVDGATFHQIGGYLGIVTALNAFYVAAADVLKGVAGRDILPTFPFPKRA